MLRLVSVCYRLKKRLAQKFESVCLINPGGTINLFGGEGLILHGLHRLAGDLLNGTLSLEKNSTKAYKLSSERIF